MTISIADFRARFPEYDDDTDYGDPRIQLFIGDSATLYMGVDEAHWGDKYDIAQAYLVAHLLALSEGSELGDKSAKSGKVQSRTAGGVSVSYAAGDASDDFFNATIYGQQFDQIRQTCFFGVLSAKG